MQGCMCYPSRYVEEEDEEEEKRFKESSGQDAIASNPSDKEIIIARRLAPFSHHCIAHQPTPTNTAQLQSAVRLLGV
ncbi:hypothetical protein BDDG_12010 [Blastomyces dermatitidis ATCC 18188]|uniref:Uncharacterized protein n=1 Tax=Ajellomyces dermatitidis (strain ATCC 18188 / CBS 674.68) TaxID=653446 RepID=A0A0J9HDX8_AJEDA|nr:hypothetical protein BDDG_12010 [Blastomyces dermatitidis ATCC 18188]